MSRSERGGGIRLSPKHGLNATIPLCIFCLKPKNEVVLAGYLPGDIEAPMHAIWDEHPCDECKGFMRDRVILVGVIGGGPPPHGKHSGHLFVVSEETVQRIFNEETVPHLLKQRAAFVEVEALQALGVIDEEGNLTTKEKKE